MNTGKTTRIRKAVFPAAGVGTRFLPITKAVPKEMLPLIDKPLIQYGVEEAIASGLEEIIIVTGRGKTAIEDHFDTSVELETLLKEKGKNDLLKEMEGLSGLANFTYTRQKRPLGLGDAILRAKNIVNEEPFAVFLGDDIIDADRPVMKQMVEVFERYPYTILAVQRVPEEDIHRYGVIKGELIEERVYRVIDMVEKPSMEEAPSNLAIIGRYILSPDIFDALINIKPGKGGEVQITDAILELSRSQHVYAYEFEGDRYDAGDKLGFLKANVSFALKRPDIRDGFREFLNNLKLNEL
ncbi:MAG: UTP--glucose-1-phosphate uridylyltransferase GalU [Thermodesulfobacteriota bacterium]